VCRVCRAGRVWDEDTGKYVDQKFQLAGEKNGLKKWRGGQWDCHVVNQSRKKYQRGGALFGGGAQEEICHGTFWAGSPRC
jgi:hypothetical protein